MCIRTQMQTALAYCSQHTVGAATPVANGCQKAARKAGKAHPLPFEPPKRGEHAGAAWFATHQRICICSNPSRLVEPSKAPGPSVCLGQPNKKEKRENFHAQTMCACNACPDKPARKKHTQQQQRTMGRVSHGTAASETVAGQLPTPCLWSQLTRTRRGPVPVLGALVTPRTQDRNPGSTQASLANCGDQQQGQIPVSTSKITSSQLGHSTCAYIYAVSTVAKMHTPLPTTGQQQRQLQTAHSNPPIQSALHQRQLVKKQRTRELQSQQESYSHKKHALVQHRPWAAGRQCCCCSGTSNVQTSTFQGAKPHASHTAGQATGGKRGPTNYSTVTLHYTSTPHIIARMQPGHAHNFLCTCEMKITNWGHTCCQGTPTIQLGHKAAGTP
jgi:hypothetical protein